MATPTHIATRKNNEGQVLEGIWNNAYDETEVDSAVYSRIPDEDSDTMKGNTANNRINAGSSWDPNFYTITPHNSSSNNSNKHSSSSSNSNNNSTSAYWTHNPSMMGSGTAASAGAAPLVVSRNNNRTLVVVCILSLLVACAAIAIAVVALTKDSGGSTSSSPSSSSSSSADAAASTATANAMMMRADIVSINATFNHAITAMHAVDNAQSAALAATSDVDADLRSDLSAINATLSATDATQNADLATIHTTLSTTANNIQSALNAVDTSLRSDINTVNTTLSTTMHTMQATLTNLTETTTNQTATTDSMQSALSTMTATLANLTTTLSAVVAQNTLLGNMMQAMSQTQQQLAADITSLRSFRFSTSLCTGSSTGWTSQTMSPVGTLCRRTNTAANGCGSIFLNPGRTYSNVSGWVTLYQYATTGAFGVDASPPYGDSLTIWAGSTFLWDFGVGYSESYLGSTDSHNCPAKGGPNPSSVVGNYWYCASGAPTAPPFDTFFPTPLFGPNSTFSRNIPPTSLPLELRFCLNQNNYNEDIYIGDFELIFL